MRRILTAFAVAGMVASMPAPAYARLQFAAYDGPDAVQMGTGGTKIVKEGVDYWTSGTPPRRYKVLGILTDTRKDKLLSGKAIGSSGIAKRVLKMGGQGIVVLDQDTRGAGFVGAFNSFGGFGGRAVHNITTQFLIVQYLD